MFGAGIQVLESGGYEVSVFAAPDDLAGVFHVTVRFPDGAEQALQLADDSWRYLGMGTPPIGTYAFLVALTDGTSFEKTIEYAGEGY